MHVRKDRPAFGSAVAAPGLSRRSGVEGVAAMLTALTAIPAAEDPGGLIDEIAALERLQAAAAAAQLRCIARFADAHESDQRAAGVPGRRIGAGVADQVALACRVSATAGAHRVTMARALTRQLPHTMRLLSSGDISPWVATLMVRETAVLSPQHRQAVDASMAATITTMSPRRVEAAARRAGIGLDPASATRRGRTARTDRRVSIRPAPDTMSLVTGFLPCEQGVGAWATLTRDATALRSAGDPRSLDQIRADLFHQRLTGQHPTTGTPVEIAITMSCDALLDLDSDDTAAHLAGYGPIPTPLARTLAGIPTEDIGADAHVKKADAPTADRAKVFLRRIFTDPIDHTVSTIDTKRRRFDSHLARFIAYRDQTCRMPYCTAPIRHLDHITARRDHGATSARNGQGLCEHHNYTKELPGWRTVIRPGSPHTTIVTTPTGHSYQSTAPPANGP